MTDSPSLFDLLLPKRKMKSKIRLIELFAGIGSQAKALKKLGIAFDHHKVCEIDKYAIKSYNAIHNTSFETNDITKLNYKDLEIENTDEIDYIMTYSFPCQDLSLAGNRKGMEKGNNTRSGLLWQVERLLTECNENKCLPQILLMENVRQVITAKGWHDWCAFLEKIGYSNYCEILNGTDFGIPQNRERAFMISILGEYSYSMPKQLKLELILKDMLEKQVDEKYFLSNKMIEYISANNEKWTGNNNSSLINKTIASTINTGEGHRRCDASNYICKDLPNNFDLKIHKSLRETLETNNIEDGSVVDCYNRTIKNSGIINTITTRCDASNNLYIVVPEKTIKTSVDDNLQNKLCNHLIENNLCEEGDIIKHSYTGQILNGRKKCVEKSDGIMITLPTRADCIGVCVNDQSQLRIRKLTPKECYRLMGFDDEDYQKASQVNSNAQLYKQAGNSIIVHVLMAIFGKLFNIDYITKIKEDLKKYKE